MRELLEGLEELTLVLGSEGSVRVNYPHVLFLLLSFDVVVIITSKTFLLPLLALLISLVLAIRMDKVRKKAVMKIIVLSAIFSLPLLISRPQEAVVFFIRVVASSALVAAIVTLLGWYTLVRGVEGWLMPRGFADASRMMLIYSHRWIMDLLKVIMARKARLLSDDKKREIVILATGVGESLQRSMEKARVVSLAVEARTFGRGSEGGKTNPFVFLMLFIPILLWVIENVGI